MAKYYIGIYDGYSNEYKERIYFNKQNGLLDNHKKGEANLNLIKLDQYFLSPKSQIDEVNDELSFKQKIKNMGYDFETGDKIGITRINKNGDDLKSSKVIYNDIPILDYIGMLILLLKKDGYNSEEIKLKLKNNIHFIKYNNHINNLLKNDNFSKSLNNAHIVSRTRNTMYDLAILYSNDTFDRKNQDNYEIDYKKKFLLDCLTSYKEFRNLSNHIYFLEKNNYIDKYYDDKLEDSRQELKGYLYPIEVNYLSENNYKEQKEITKPEYDDNESGYGIEEDGIYHTGEQIR